MVDVAAYGVLNDFDLAAGHPDPNVVEPRTPVHEIYCTRIFISIALNLLDGGFSRKKDP